MTTNDKLIIEAILTYIGSNTHIEDEIAKYVGNQLFDMSEDKFSDWLSKVKVVD